MTATEEAARKTGPGDAVAEGMFFASPSPLPRGRHGMSRDEVNGTRRERMLIAATELLARDGYRAVGVREICARAAISRSAFYAVFTDKDDCLFAAYDRFITVLADRIGRVPRSAGRWPGFLHDLVHAYLSTLEGDRVVARAFQVELDSLGAGARSRRRAAMHALAGLVERHWRDWPGRTVPDPPAETFVAAVYAIRQLSIDALDRDDPDLTVLADDWAPWLARLLPDPSPDDPPLTRPR